MRQNRGIFISLIKTDLSIRLTTSNSSNLLRGRGVKRLCHSNDRILPGAGGQVTVTTLGRRNEKMQ